MDTKFSVILKNWLRIKKFLNLIYGSFTKRELMTWRDRLKINLRFNLSDSDLTGLYHYEGSLTTPGCAEIVQWIVLDTPLYVRSNGLVSDYN